MGAMTSLAARLAEMAKPYPALAASRSKVAALAEAFNVRTARAIFPPSARRAISLSMSPATTSASRNTHPSTNARRRCSKAVR